MPDKVADPGSKKTSHLSVGGPLADKSAQSIMSNVEMSPSRLKRLTSGLAIGAKDDDGADAVKSHSIGDLSSMSVKSLGVASKGDGDDGEDPANKEEEMEDTTEKNESIGMTPQWLSESNNFFPLLQMPYHKHLRFRLGKQMKGRSLAMALVMWSWCLLLRKPLNTRQSFISSSPTTVSARSA